MAMDPETPLPFRGEGSEVDKIIWSFLPDLWGDCSSERSKKKSRRRNFKERLLKAIEDERSANKTEVPTT